MVDNFENVPPMSVPPPHGAGGSTIKRGRDELTQTYSRDKRPRQDQTHAHLNQLYQQTPTSYDPTQSTSIKPSMVYDPSIGTYAPMPQQSATPAAPNTYVAFGAPLLPGAARYKKQLVDLRGSKASRPTTSAHSPHVLPRAAVQPSNPVPLAKSPLHLQFDERQMFQKPSGSAPEPHTENSEPPRGTQHNPVELLSSPEPEEPFKKTKKKKKGKNKFYAVAAGHVPGVYTEWSDVERQIKGYSGNSYHGFATETEARAWFEEHKTSPKPQPDYSRPADRDPYRQSLYPDPTVEQLPNGALLSSDGRNNSASADGPKMRSSSGAPEFIPFPPTSQWAAPPQYQTSAISANPDVVPIVEPPLCREQAELVDLILSGRNVFYTGSAGCGKSVQ